MSFHVKLHKMERVMSKFLKEHTAISYRDIFRYTRENYSSCVQLSCSMQNSRQNYFVQGILQDEIIKVMYLILQKILITMSKTNN